MIGYPTHLHHRYSTFRHDYATMFGFIKRKQNKSGKATTPPAEAEPVPVASQPASDATTAAAPAGTSDTPDEVKALSESLEKTRRGFTDSMADFFLGKKSIDQAMLDDLEERLLSADVGMDATTTIIDELHNSLSRKALNNEAALHRTLAGVMTAILQPCEQPLELNSKNKPFVILVVGINGAGKTTSIGKLANYFKQQGKSVMLAAGDTFRAAAVEQLQTWGQRNEVPVIAQGTGADPASVIFDAVESASSKNIDVVIADTAGRLHTQDNLMEELKKIKRVMTKLDPDAPHETLIIMDAGFGQNALHQVQQFHD
ncbi:MAG TPA: signal recognition particle-docking protein FtsY, partial [Thiotrichales bacterium]|nr:signal recognition particle-docking protein FtsY [Thiotrichales bacterium]